MRRNSPPKMVASTHCQICARPILANTGVIAHHGYERPHRGSGFQTASCLGARYAPYEESCDRIPYVIGLVEDHIARRTSWLADFIANPPAKLLKEVEGKYLGRGKHEPSTFVDMPKPEGFTVDGKNYVSEYSDYAYQFRSLRREAESDIQGSTATLKFLQKRLADWGKPAVEPPKPIDVRKNAGYINHVHCYAACGGKIVLYDRNKGFDCDADERWIVMHEPSSIHVAVKTKKQAEQAMYDAGRHPEDVLGQPIEAFTRPEEA